MKFQCFKVKLHELVNKRKANLTILVLLILEGMLRMCFEVHILFCLSRRLELSFDVIHEPKVFELEGAKRFPFYGFASLTQFIHWGRGHLQVNLKKE